MGLFEMLSIAIALAMDACAVSLAVGLSGKTQSRARLLRLPLSFGLFQGAMPVIGWLVGRLFYSFLSLVDHWIAFGLLCFIGAKMLREAFSTEDEQPKGDPTSIGSLLLLSIATSIDALAVGLSFAALGQPILLPSAVIAVVTGLLSACAIWLGGRVGEHWGKRAEIFGGSLLIILGLNILIEHI